MITMKNLKDQRTKIYPSTTRGGKGLPSSSALDSPSVMRRLATPHHAINPDMSQVIDDATSMNATHDDASTLLDDGVPLGVFLDEQIARQKGVMAPGVSTPFYLGVHLHLDSCYGLSSGRRFSRSAYFTSSVNREKQRCEVGRVGNSDAPSLCRVGLAGGQDSGQG